MRNLAKLTIALVLTGAAAAAQTPSQSSIELRFEPRNASTDRLLTGTAVLRAVDESQKREDMTIEGGRLLLRGSAGARWEVIASFPGWWAAPRVVTIPRDVSSLHELVPVWRTGVVEGKLVPAAPTEELPSSIEVIVESPPQPSRAVEIARGSAFTCPVSADGRWSCALPATTLDLVVRAKGHLPHYRWDVKVPVASNENVGVMQLQRGASVTAWLDKATAAALTKPAEARLVRLMADPSSQTAARLARPIAESRFSRRGVVQLGPVPPGTYILEVRSEGYASARAYPIEVYEQKETSLRKVMELKPPIALRIEVDPALDPSGKPWRVGLRRASDFSSGFEPSSEIVSATDPTGAVRISDQAPGLFRATIYDSAHNSMAHRDVTARDELEVNHRITVDTHRIRGRLRMGDAPLAATLWFGGRKGITSVRMVSAEDGTFAGALPKTGKWPVGVETSDGRVNTTTTVEVAADDDAIEIVLGSGVVAGYVVDADGLRVPQADVVAITKDGGPIETRADQEGNFRFNALPAGQVYLDARDRRTGGSSRSTAATVSDDDSPAPIEVRLTARSAIEGLVVAAGRPVVGARVTAFATHAGQPFGSQGRATTNEQGRFRVDVTEGSPAAVITVAAPSHALRAFNVNRSPAGVTLEIDRAGGTVVLSPPAGATAISLTQNSAFLAVTDLMSWGRGHGEPSTFPVVRAPNMAAGTYRGCVTLEQNGERGERRCRTLSLAPGGTITFDFPAE